MAHDQNRDHSMLTLYGCAFSGVKYSGPLMTFIHSGFGEMSDSEEDGEEEDGADEGFVESLCGLLEAQAAVAPPEDTLCATRAPSEGKSPEAELDLEPSGPEGEIDLESSAVDEAKAPERQALGRDSLLTQLKRHEHANALDGWGRPIQCIHNLLSPPYTSHFPLSRLIGSPILRLARVEFQPMLNAVEEQLPTARCFCPQEQVCGVPDAPTHGLAVRGRAGEVQ